MSADRSTRPGLRALWHVRPSYYPRALWALLLTLDLLPWPWGEDILARLFVARAFLRTTRLRQALRWAACQPRPRWPLALALCAYHGRLVAQACMLGRRGPDELRRFVVVRGGEHLPAPGRPTILLGFHLGAKASDVALKLAGHSFIRLGGPRVSRSWLNEAWSRFLSTSQIVVPIDDTKSLSSALYEARRRLLEGGTLFTLGDGHGRAAFQLDLPGGPLPIRSGWLALRRHTGAVVLPVLSHLEGRRQVVTVHPPLPAVDPDSARDLHACRAALGQLVQEYVRRFPEQCPSLVYWHPDPGVPPEGVAEPTTQALRSGERAV